MYEVAIPAAATRLLARCDRLDAAARAIARERGGAGDAAGAPLAATLRALLRARPEVV